MASEVFTAAEVLDQLEASEVWTAEDDIPLQDLLHFTLLCRVNFGLLLACCVPQPLVERIFEFLKEPAFESFDCASPGEGPQFGGCSCGPGEPRPLQRGVIGLVAGGRDAMIQAPCETGKTAAVAIGTARRIDTSRKASQCLILVPSSIVGKRVFKVVFTLSGPLGVTCFCAFSDSRYDGEHLVVASPDRAVDLFGWRRPSRKDGVRLATVALLETDEMLACGFMQEICTIFRSSPSAQVCLLSDTMAPDVLDLTANFLRDPVRILRKRATPTLEGVHQFYVDVETEEWKFDTLCELYEAFTLPRVIIYCNLRRKVDFLKVHLRSLGFGVSALHTDMDYKDRDLVMRDFFSGTSQVLISRDSLMWGVDIQEVTLVLNYDLPQRPENYLQRVGRSSCEGRSGLAISFVTRADVPTMKAIEEFHHTQILEMPMDIADLM